MTRCTEFYKKLERDGNFCGMREDHLREALEYLELVEANPQIRGITESAAKPLIREKDSDVKAKVLEAVAKNISNGNVPTAKQVKTILENKRAGVKPGGRILGAGDSLPNQPKRTMGDFLTETPTKEDLSKPIVFDPEVIDEERDYYSGDTPEMPDELEKSNGDIIPEIPVTTENPEVEKSDIKVPADISDIADEMEKTRVAQATKDLQKEKEDERERNEITEKNKNAKNRDVLVSVLTDALRSALHEGITRKEVFEALHIALDSVFEPIESNEERTKPGSEPSRGGLYK